MNSPIDIVIPWVDGTDPAWINERNKYSHVKDDDKASFLNNRYQSWNNLHLWFRAIDECMPWINNVFLITCGHVPEFINQEYDKLKIVKHFDFIPWEYLPTFNSNTIEMNIHRIKELSENYILFNDDVFPLKYIDEDYYFKNDVVCDEAIENIITTGSFTSGLHVQRYAQLNNMFIINKYFKKKEVQAANWDKWYCEDYGDRLERTKACAYWYDFPGFYDPHLANALKKSTLAHLWEIESEVMHKGSLDRFRGADDVTQYLIRYWQLCTGDFIPRRTRGKVFFPNINTYQDTVDYINKSPEHMISFNENCSSEEFPVIRDAINSALEKRFPNKCSYEK